MNKGIWFAFFYLYIQIYGKSLDVTNSTSIAALMHCFCSTYALHCLCCAIVVQLWLFACIFNCENVFAVFMLCLCMKNSNGNLKPMCKSHCDSFVNASEITTALQCIQMQSKSPAKVLWQHCDKVVTVATFEYCITFYGLLQLCCKPW